jgi:hypothetical protein
MEDIRLKIDELRQKALAGTMTIEDCKTAVELCRLHRGKAAVRPPGSEATKRLSKSPTPRVSSETLLKGL